jgi:hypothetical protein
LKRNENNIWLKNLKRRKHSKDQDEKGKKILDWSYGNRVENCGLDACDSG